MDIESLHRHFNRLAKQWRKGPGKVTARFLRGLSTLSHSMGWPGRQYGFFIPYRWAWCMPHIGENDAYDWLKQAWDSDQSAFKKSLDMIQPHLDTLAEFATENPDDRDCPRFDQSWCPGLDGAAAYSFVRELRPARIMEIGSGHSTRFMARAIRDGGLSTRLRSIDPVPRRGIDHLCHEVTRATMDQVALSEYSVLEKNDILYFDGSHVGMPGTDVDALINRVLPTLNPGVWVHIHDIFLPYGYPQVWQWRGYNEQNMVAALLAGGERFKVRFASAYIRRHMASVVGDWAIPVPRRAFEASLWLSVE